MKRGHLESMAYYILKSYKLKVGPLAIFEALKSAGNCFFLDSSLKPHSLGRFSFLGIDPFYILEAKNQNPFPRLRELLNRYKFSLPQAGLPFLGGAVGYLAYDLGFVLEGKVKKRPKADTGIPDCLFGFYNTVIIIDHLKKLLYIFSVGFPEKNCRLAKILCESNFKKTYRFIEQINPARQNKENKVLGPARELKSNFTKDDYRGCVKMAKEYIKRGDIYQVNLSQRFQAKTDLSGFAIYQRLRKVSPACFSAYFDAGDFQILSSSPERFLKLQGGTVITTPMKGTRSRGETKEKDAALKKEVINSKKDKAKLKHGP